MKRKVNKFAAAMAVALGLGVVPQANALIEMESNTTGDTLMFPVFYGYGENYFTIMNNHDEWVQGHLRFRGAVWCGELLDMDIILSPGDVFVFRLADLDGDGFWEIDQSLDPKNFEYTGMLASCGPEGSTGVAKDQCRDQSSLLIPEPNVNDDPKGNLTEDLITHHRNIGQIEFIGEGILVPKAAVTARMPDFINPDKAGTLADLGQRRVGNQLGTHLWSWVDAYEAYPTCDQFGVAQCFGGRGFEHQQIDVLGILEDNVPRRAADMPNVLSGTAFLTEAGSSYGLAYNAEALVNFRTNQHPHRVDNYTCFDVNGDQDCDPAVILHHENSIETPTQYAYLYHYEEKRTAVPISQFEARISFNNTWGPTLADGDDYTGNSGDFQWLASVAPNAVFTNVGADEDDAWDSNFNLRNSILEVDEAVRKRGQVFTSFYFDNATFDKACAGNGREDNPACSTSTLQSWYFAFFPQRFLAAGEDRDYWLNPLLAQTRIGFQSTDRLLGKRGYLEAAVSNIINSSKPFGLEVWDIFENTPRGSTATCDVSPCIGAEVITAGLPIREQVAIFNIKTIKDKFGKGGSHQSWDSGRVVVRVDPAADEWCDDIKRCQASYAGLMYTFDWASDGTVTQWRSMHRGYGR